MKIDKLTDKIIEVRIEGEYGVTHSFYVSDAKSNGTVKLTHVESSVLQASKLLVQWMHTEGVDRDTLASMLGKSKSTVSRYINGTRKIPYSVLSELGISGDLVDNDTEEQSRLIAKTKFLIKSALEELNKI